MRDTFARTLHEIAKEDPRVFIVVGDISPAGSMEPFRTEFPDHFVNVGVAEQSMIGIAAGLALRGCTAFAYTIATFSIYRPFEQIRDDLCYQNLPVTVVGIGGGVSYSLLGGTHHAQEDVAVMGSLPNMNILAPCDPAETQAATWFCAEKRGPVYLRLGKAGEPDLTANAIDPFEFGKLRKIREGRDVCLVSYGPIMSTVVDLAAKLESERGQSAAVYSAHTLKPFDRAGLAKIMNNYETVAVIEEHSERNGLGSIAKEIGWESRSNCILHTFGLKDEFIHAFGSQTDLWRAHGLTSEIIYSTITGR